MKLVVVKSCGIMKFSKLFVILFVLLNFCDWSSGLIPLFLVPIVLPYFALFPWIGGYEIPFLILLKLLAIKKALLLTIPLVGVGSLAIGTGAGLLAGKLGAIVLMNKLQPYKDMYHAYRELNAFGHSHGYNNFGEWFTHAPKFEIHKNRNKLRFWLGKLIPLKHKVKVRAKPPTYYNYNRKKTIAYNYGWYSPQRPPMPYDYEDIHRDGAATYNSEQTLNPPDLNFLADEEMEDSDKDFPGLTIAEAQKYLELHLGKFETKNPHLLSVLKQAYAQTLYDLGGDHGKVPAFVPFPNSYDTGESNNSNSNSTSKSESEPIAENSDQDMLNFNFDYSTKLKDAAKEAGEFFSLISSFDEGTCFEKLVCDIHTRTGEAEDPNKFSPYETNVISLFRAMKLAFPEKESSDVVTTKYLRAAAFGSEHLSPRFCQKRYPNCSYDSNQVMEMGNELEDSSPFSIPKYLWGKWNGGSDFSHPLF